MILGIEPGSEDRRACDASIQGAEHSAVLHQTIVRRVQIGAPHNGAGRRRDELEVGLANNCGGRWRHGDHLYEAHSTDSLPQVKTTKTHDKLSRKGAPVTTLLAITAVTDLGIAGIEALYYLEDKNYASGAIL